MEFFRIIQTIFYKQLFFYIFIFEEITHVTLIISVTVKYIIILF